MLCLLCYILHNRCGKGFIWITSSTVVNFHQKNTKISSNSNQNNKNTFSLEKRFPFDSNNPVGYLAAVSIEYVVLVYAYCMIACILGLGIGAFWFVIAVIKEIRRLLRLIRGKAKVKKNQSRKLKSFFFECVYTHAAIKQLSML